MEQPIARPILEKVCLYFPHFPHSVVFVLLYSVFIGKEKSRIGLNCTDYFSFCDHLSSCCQLSLLAYKASLIAVLMGYFWCLAGAEFDRFIGITGLYIIEFQRVWKWERKSNG